jgi:hypothetical protein
VKTVEWAGGGGVGLVGFGEVAVNGVNIPKMVGIALTSPPMKRERVPHE